MYYSNIASIVPKNEKCSIKTKQHMACGKSVITTKVGGNREVINSKDYGILVDLDDQKQLKNAIIKALEKNGTIERSLSMLLRITGKR